MSLKSVVLPYETKTEEAGEGRFYLRFTVGATGAVPATFPDGFTRASNSILSVTRLLVGIYKVVFDGFFVPGYSAANPGNNMGSNLGVTPMMEVDAQIVGNNATYGTNATECRVIVDNTNNQDASGVCFLTIECDAPGVGAADPAAGDELSVVFTLKTERP